MTQNRPSDLVDERRNSFGLLFPNHVLILGTKGDVETFFLLLNDLLSERVLTADYSAIADDLFRTLINRDNLRKFKDQTTDLKEKFAKIRSNQIDWQKYPFNRVRGEFDYQQLRIDPSKTTLFDVFEFFFTGFEKALLWVEESISRNGKYSRLIVAPTEIHTSRKFKKSEEIDFLEAAESPLWLREPS